MRRIWWSGGDPHALDLGSEASFGIKRESLIMKDLADAIVEEGLRDYRQWESERTTAVLAGSTASMRVRTVTEWAADPASGCQRWRSVLAGARRPGRGRAHRRVSSAVRPVR